jgi:predicted ATPase
VLRQAFANHAGAELRTEGDSFFAAFASARNAVAAAEQAQAALAAGPLPVRIGIHTGEPLPVEHEDGYVGVDVHRAARICAAGHGGQVLISQATKDLLDPGVELRDLGEHRLKDLGAPERIWQLGEAEFPRLKTLYQTNLPVPATPFLGRERELRELGELLSRDDVRLLTLTGPGGTGKTRLALQAVAALADEYEDGVFWVPLAPLRDPELVLQAAAGALGTKDELASHLADRRVLLLLDNFEQVVAAASQLGAVLSACPGLDLVVTSRERLQLAAEHEWPVPPLERADAVDLFTQRSRAVGVEPSTNGAASELCARLDDLPLAVELAAARTKLFSPAQLLERLGGRLDLLKGGRDADPRQQTLRATIRWSYDLLTDEEQTLFARFSVFAGGCTLEAAEEVCAADPDMLASLVDKSLVRRRGGRLSMLETIREFAAERFEESADCEAIHRAHADFFLRLGQSLERPVRDGDREAMAAMAAELDNFRSVLDWAVARSEPLYILGVVEALWYFPTLNGYGREGLHWAELSLEAAERVSPAESAFALSRASELFRAFGDRERALRIKYDVIPVLDELGEQEAAAWVVGDLAAMNGTSGHFAEARRLADEALKRRRALGDARGMEHALQAAAQVEFHAGDFARAHTLYSEALSLCREAAIATDALLSILMIGECARRIGDVAEAKSQLLEATKGVRDFGWRDWYAELLQEIAALSRASDAALLLGASERLLDESGHGRWDPADYNRTVAATRKRLGDEAFDSAWRDGLALDEDSAFEIGVRSLQP